MKVALGASPTRCVLCLLLQTFEVASPAFSRSSTSDIMIVHRNFEKINIIQKLFFMFSMCSFSRNSSLARAECHIARGSTMGRVPASFMRAESVFYWIRQEKRKRRDAIAHLEAKSLHFYTKATSEMQSRYEAIAKLDTQMNEKEDVNLPPLPIIDFKKDVAEDVTDKDGDDELMHWYNNENDTHEDNFYSQVKSLDVPRETEQHLKKVYDEQVGNRAARHAPGIALVSLVQRAAEADGKKLADSIEQVAARLNEQTTLTKQANEYVEKFLAVFIYMSKIASVANKSKLSFSESFQRILGCASEFERRALQFCEATNDDLMFSASTVVLLAQGRAQNHVRACESVRYASMAEYMCREIFTLAKSTLPANHELTRADVKRALRTTYFSELCRKLGFGIEGQ